MLGRRKEQNSQRLHPQRLLRRLRLRVLDVSLWQAYPALARRDSGASVWRILAPSRGFFLMGLCSQGGLIWDMINTVRLAAHCAAVFRPDIPYH